MDRPTPPTGSTPPTSRPGTPTAGHCGLRRCVAGHSTVAPPEAARLTRPDGRLQVGVGAQAWLVEGWSPDPTSSQDPATALLCGLAGSGPARGLPPYRVSGHGELAAELREGLASTLGEPAQDGVVVLVSDYAVPVGTARRPDLVAAPVLPVVAQTSRVVLGPWTGLAGGPCLHCLDLHRHDHDPGWPLLAAALDDPVTSLVPPRHGCGVVALVRALAAVLVAGVRRDGRGTHALAYEVGRDQPHLVTRRWPAHPACPWHTDGPGGR